MYSTKQANLSSKHVRLWRLRLKNVTDICTKSKTMMRAFILTHHNDESIFLFLFFQLLFLLFFFCVCRSLFHSCSYCFFLFVLLSFDFVWMPKNSHLLWLFGTTAFEYELPTRCKCTYINNWICIQLESKRNYVKRQKIMYKQKKSWIEKTKKRQRLKSPAHQMLHIDWISRVYTYEYVHKSCVEIVNEMSISFYVPFLFCSYKAAHKNPNHSSIHRAFHVCVCVFEWGKKKFFALCSSLFFWK